MVNLNSIKHISHSIVIKLFLGFWLCTSLVIISVSSIPLMKQLLEQAIMPVELEEVLVQASSQLQQNPEIIDSGSLLKWQKNQSINGKPVRVFLFDENDNFIGKGSHRYEVNKIKDLVGVDGKPMTLQRGRHLLFGPHLFNLNGKVYKIYGSVSKRHPYPVLSFVIHNTFVTVLIALLFSGAACWLLSWHFTKPIKRLKQHAELVTQGMFESRIEKRIVERNDELGQLATSFNQMTNSVEQMIASQKELISNISHELRTPLTRLKLSTAIAEKQPLTPDELARFNYEIDLIESMISELLELSRQETSYSNTYQKENVSSLLMNICDDATFEAKQFNRNVNIQLQPSIVLNVEPNSFTRAIENILRNAIKYSESAISISSYQEQHFVIIEISDDGPGVEPSELENIFKPFYRPEKSRSRESGGWGLGLAIAKAAIENHNGLMTAKNNVPQGLNIKIKLPT